MRFASLGSGSRGNATLIEAGKTRVLVDCGFSLRELEARLPRLGLSPADLHAILVTHEHADHIRGVGALARKYRLPVWASSGTLEFAGLGALPERQVLNVHTAVSLQDLGIEPFPVPHDAREPCQFVFSDGRVRVGLLTDTGSLTRHIIGQLDGCAALMLECNHDVEMLADGPYPPALKRRVGGDYGHLSNHQAAEVLAKMDTGCLQRVIAMHISEKNNDPGLAASALCTALACDYHDIQVAEQERGFDWITV
ncbi:MAG: MBL fold metallo-hydrolase [Gammaproteobacteria bacterium]